MKVLLIVLTIICFLLVAIGIAYLVSIYWQNYDVQKCNAVENNSYYYAQNDCYKTLYMPFWNQLNMFIAILVVEVFIGVLISAIIGGIKFVWGEIQNV